MRQSSKQSTSPGKMNKSRRRNARRIPLYATITALSITPTIAQETCPPSTDGWSASSDCKTYFWCSAGTRSSITYDCIDNTAFDVAQSSCVPSESFTCAADSSEDASDASSNTDSTMELTTGIDWASNGVSQVVPVPTAATTTTATLTTTGGDGNTISAPNEGEEADDIDVVSNITIGGLESATSVDDESATAIPALQTGSVPTAYPTKLGPPLYYGDFRTSSCLSAAANNDTLAVGAVAPAWITDEVLFASKEECCDAMFGWAPIENCLGAGWVETNYVRGTMPPTGTPTMLPTEVPSLTPTTSIAPTLAPSAAASGMPSVMASEVPSSSPTYGPTTLIPTLSPTSSAPTSETPTMMPTSAAPTVEVVRVTRATTGAEEPRDVQTMESFSEEDEEYSATRPIGGSNEGSFTASESYEASDSQSEVNPDDPINFLVELLSYTNSEYSPSEVSSVNVDPTVKPMSDSFSISEIILPILEDATVSQLRQTLNFGANSALAVDGGSGSDGSIQRGDSEGERFDSLLKFDIGMIDPSFPIDKASLRIFSLEECLSGVTFVTTTDASWGQDSVTWEQAPAADGYEIGSMNQVEAETWYELDMLSALAWNEALGNFSRDQNVVSVRISSSSNSRCMFSSMESGQAKAPYMSVTYGQGSGMTEFGAAAGQPPATGQFLLLKATDDSTLDASNPGANSGTDLRLRVSFDSTTRDIVDTVIRFDLSEVAGASPVAAVLTLYAEQDCSSAGNIYTAAEDSSWSELDINWSNAPSYQEGVSRGGLKVGTFGEVRAHRWYGFDVLKAAQQAVAENRQALTFRINSNGDGECVFSSKESGRDPKLMVSF